MTRLFERYKQNDDWLVVEGIPDTRDARILALAASCWSDSYNVQRRLGKSVMDVAFKNLHIPAGTEDVG
jgi:hypothetical protein